VARDRSVQRRSTSRAPPRHHSCEAGDPDDFSSLGFRSCAAPDTNFAELMMRIRLTRPALALVLGTSVLFAGCDSGGPAERAGRSIDNAARDARDAIAPGGPMEKAGRDVDRALQPGPK